MLSELGSPAAPVPIRMRLDGVCQYFADELDSTWSRPRFTGKATISES
jgi:hypothetical protein